MKRNLLLRLLAILLPAAAAAWDGRACYPEEWTRGNIYAQDQRVSMEKALLAVRQLDGTATIRIEFQNTTGESILLPCAIPLSVALPYEIRGGRIIPSGARPDAALWRLAAGRDALSGGKELREEDLAALDGRLRTMGSEEFFAELAADGAEGKYGCAIAQDGSDVPIQNVGIETALDGQESLVLTLYFFHELKFTPWASSRVSAAYAAVPHMRVPAAPCGTWREGAAGAVVIFADGGMEEQGGAFEETELPVLDGMEHAHLYAAWDWAPLPGEHLEFTARAMDDAYESFPEKRPRQDFVRAVRASSFMKGTFKMATGGTSTYEPESSFDGILYNGWVEGAKGTGRGEWLEFRLTRPALGPFATNGLTRSAYNAATWASNNRVRSLRLQSIAAGGTRTDIAQLALEDTYPAMLFQGYECGWLCANAVRNPLFLAPGTYRLTIQDVYRSGKWDDTALGEVWFYELGDHLALIISDDSRTGNPFFTPPLLDAIQDYLGRWQRQAQAGTEHIPR